MEQKSRRWRLDWPLLGKELLEQAARKQMYVIRVTYALLLFGSFCFYYIRNLGEGQVLALGGGLGPFRFLVAAQLLAIFLFLPPLMAGAIAQEKERDTLGLLFLTDLTPWELILQKYLGRLIPMLTLLFLSLPLLAVAYSLGGVSASMLGLSAATLFLTCLTVGAVALECSAHQGTTFSALMRCWGICLLLAIFCGIAPSPLWFISRIFRVGIQSGGLSMPGQPLSSLRSIAPGIPMALFAPALVYLFITLAFLFRAKQILEPRAFVHGRNPFAHEFKVMDQYWKDVHKLMRALLRKRDKEASVLARQVIQRQLQSPGTQAWSPGSFLLARMQVPGLLAGSAILGSIVLIFTGFNIWMDSKSASLFVIVGGFWIIAMLTIPIQSANAVASERINERLGPLLTTPLTGQEILAEWLAPIQRWIVFLMRPLAAVFLLEAFLKFRAAPTSRWGNLILYLGISFLTLLIYPRLVQWSCLWIGLRIHSQMRAMMTALFTVVAWCIIPLPLFAYLKQTGLLPWEWCSALQFISPISVIRLAEKPGQPVYAGGSPDLILLVMHLGVATWLIWTFRRACLTKADQYLGRN